MRRESLAQCFLNFLSLWIALVGVRAQLQNNMMTPLFLTRWQCRTTRFPQTSYTNCQFMPEAKMNAFALLLIFFLK